MKIAFCYSGMFRDFTKNIDNHIENLFSGHDVDIYMSFWDIQGLGNFRNPVEGVDSETITDEEKDTVIQKLNPKFVDYEHFLPMEKYFKKVEIQKEQVRDFPPYIRNIMSMYYKIQKCGVEVEKSGIEYDLVVRLRTDLWFNQKVDFTNIKKGVFYYNVFKDMSWGGDCYDDKFFYGDLQVMNRVKNIYSDLDNLWSKTNYFAAPEHLLYLGIKMNEIESKDIIINYRIVEN